MASRGYLQTVVQALPDPIRGPVLRALDHVVTTFRIGGGPKAQNFAWYIYNATTPATALEEFSVAHGQGQAPTKLIPYLDLQQVGSQLTRYNVTRLPDTQRVYLSSPSTSVDISFMLEF